MMPAYPSTSGPRGGAAAYASSPLVAPAGSTRRQPRRVAERTAYAVLVCVALAFGAGAVVGFKPALTILVSLAFLAALVGLLRPVLGLYAVTVLCILDAVTRVALLQGGLLRWNSLNYLLALAAGLGAPFLLTFRSGQLRLLQAFVLVLVFGLIISPQPATGMQDVLAAASVFGLIVYFVRASATPDAWYYLGWVSGATGALAGWAFYAEPTRLAIDHNAWALASTSALFGVCFARAQDRGQGRGAIPFVVLAMVNLWWIFLSGSRGALTIAMVGVIYLVGTMPGMRRRAMAVGVGALVLLGAATQYRELQEQALYRVRKLGNQELSLANRTSSRSTLVIGGWRIFRAQPFTGVGTGGFPTAWRLYPHPNEIPGYWRFPEGKQAHAGWIKALAENGILGGLLLAGVVGSFALRGLRTRDRHLALMGVLTTVALGLTFSTTEYVSKCAWFLAAGAFTLLHQDAILWRPTEGT
jgi:hypothetical protein